MTIKQESTADIKISKSKFIAHAYPLSNKDNAVEILNLFKKKYYDASHFPYAFRTGIEMNQFRYSDDGEPSGSSGKPLLGALDKYEVTNIILITARYFGGIKLGVGGLRRAFFQAGDECLKKASIVKVNLTGTFLIEFEYTFMNKIMKLIDEEEIIIIKNQSEENCSLTIEIIISKIKKILLQLKEITNGGIGINKIEN